jgi:hypothetical protein
MAAEDVSNKGHLSFLFVSVFLKAHGICPTSEARKIAVLIGVRKPGAPLELWVVSWSECWYPFKIRMLEPNTQCHSIEKQGLSKMIKRRRLPPCAL